MFPRRIRVATPRGNPVNRPIHGGSVGLAFAATNQDVARSSPAGSQPEAGLDAMKQLVHEQLWLLRTSYVLRRLRLPAFSDRLQACGLSSSRCSTRSDCSFGRAPHCTWKLLAPTSTGRRPSIAAPAASLHVGRSNPVGVALTRLGRLGARRFTSSNRRRSSRGIAAGFASSGPGKADTASAAQRCHLMCAR